MRALMKLQSLLSLIMSLTIVSQLSNSVLAQTEAKIATVPQAKQLYAQSRSQKQVPALFRSILPQIKRQTRVPILLPNLPAVTTDGQRIYVNGSGKSNGYRIALGSHPNCNAEACSLGYITAERGSSPYSEEATQQVTLAKNITGYYTPRIYRTSPRIEWVYKSVVYSIALPEYLYTNGDNPNSNTVKAEMIRIANSAIVAGSR
jgi:hypothetical protein